MKLSPYQELLLKMGHHAAMMERFPNLTVEERAYPDAAIKLKKALKETVEMRNDEAIDRAMKGI